MPNIFFQPSVIGITSLAPSEGRIESPDCALHIPDAHEFTFLSFLYIKLFERLGMSLSTTILISVLVYVYLFVCVCER